MEVEEKQGCLQRVPILFHTALCKQDPFSTLIWIKKKRAAGYTLLTVFLGIPGKDM